MKKLLPTITLLVLFTCFFGNQIALAQDDCAIEVVLVETSDCDANGTYTAEIIYEVDNPTNDSVDVWINNDFIGQYEIGDALVIDGIEPRENSDYDIVLICVDGDTECCFIYEYLHPECNEDECSIDFIEYGDPVCNEDGTYDMVIAYGVSNPTNDLVEIWVNGEYYGTHEPNPNGVGELVLEGIPMNPNSDFGTITVCMNDNDDCCLTIEFLQPDCGGGEECAIEVEIETSECVDGTYTLTIYYSVQNQTSEVMELWINDEYYGTIEIGPNGGGEIVIDGIEPRENSDYDILVLCMNDNDDCCFFLEYMQPDCSNGEECSIDFIEHSDPICNEDGTFEIVGEFGVSNPTNDLVDIWVNDEYYGTAEFNGNNGAGGFVLEGLEVDPNSEFGTITICMNDNEDCCLTVEFLQPDCDNGEECSVDWIDISYGPCDDGTYDLTIVYQITNPTHDFLNLWVNNEYVGEYVIETGQGTIVVEDVEPRENSAYDIVEICVVENENCCLAYEYNQPPDCEEGECSVNWIDMDSFSCNPETGTWDLVIYYDIDNATNDLLDLWINEEYIGSYEIQEMDVIEVPNVMPLDDLFFIVEICVNDNPDCCFTQEFEIEGPCEEEACSIDFIEYSDPVCNEDGTFDIIIAYGVSNPTNDLAEIWINGAYYGTHEPNPDGIGELVLEGVEIDPNSEFGTITVCMNDNEDCCLTVEFLQPDCSNEGECDITELVVDFTDCENGLYTLFVNYVIENPTDDLLDLWVNNEYAGSYEMDPSGSGFIMVDNVEPRENSDYDIVVLCVNDNPNCCAELEYMPPCENGGGPCEIDFIEIDWTECNDDGTYNILFYYGVSNPTNELIDVWVNGIYLGSYEGDPNNQGPILVEGVEVVPNMNLATLQVCVNDNDDCCLTIEYEQPFCEDEACSVDWIDISYGDCEGGTYDLTIVYQITNPTYDVLNLWVNNEYVGEYLIESPQGTIVVEDVEPRENTPYDIVEICVAENDDCCLAYEYNQPPDCEEGECSVNWVDMDSFSCNPETGTWDLVIYYDIDNATNDLLDLWINEEYIGFYEIQEMGTIEVPNVLPLDDVFFIVEICVNDNPDCCFTLESELDGPCEEEENCSVDFIEFAEPECNDGGTYSLFIEYGVTSPGNEFIDLWINGEFIDNYEITGSLEVSGIEPDGEVGTIQICVNDNPNCCLTVEYNQPDCSNAQEDIPPYQLITDTGSNEIQFIPTEGVELSYQLYNSDGRLIRNMNGVKAEHMISLTQPGIFIMKVAADRKVFYHKMLSIQ